MGGIFHLRLNIGERPIANKYREGKMKSTLKRELKVREIAKRETFGTCDVLGKSASGQLDGALCRVQVNISWDGYRMIGEGSCLQCYSSG